MQIKNRLFEIYKYARKKYSVYRKKVRIKKYILSGRKPWSVGYTDYKWVHIQNVINESSLLEKFSLNTPLPPGYGKGIDERIVEYPWVISRLSESESNLLDAGSTFNFPIIIEHPKIKNKNLIIVTLSPEKKCFWYKKISYYFGDLRNLPFKDEWFDEIVCISTLEHIGMDNKIYDFSLNSEDAKPDFKTALREFYRILKRGGKILITVPFGKSQKITREGTFFAQQFDSNSLGQLKQIFSNCEVRIDFYKYSSNGWNISDEDSCSNAEYFNIHTAKFFDDDLAAAARAIACIEIIK